MKYDPSLHPLQRGVDLPDGVALDARSRSLRRYVKDRGNVIVTYPGTTAKTVGFIGSHLAPQPTPF